MRDLIDFYPGLAQDGRRRRILFAMGHYQWRQLRDDALVGVVDPGDYTFPVLFDAECIAAAAKPDDSAGQRPWRYSTVQRPFHMIGGAQTDPAAAGFITGLEAPAANFAAAAVRQQYFTDAAGADGHYRTGLSQMRAEQGGEGVGADRDIAKARILRRKLFRPL